MVKGNNSNILINKNMIKLELEIEEVNLILTALSELPFKVSSKLIAKIKQDGDKQFQDNQTKVVV